MQVNVMVIAGAADALPSDGLGARLNIRSSPIRQARP